MSSDFVSGLKGAGEGIADWVNKAIPEPDIVIWMENTTPREKGKKIAFKVMAIAVPFFIDGILRGINSTSNAFVTGLTGAAVAIGAAFVNIGKAWVINKVIDKVIDKDSAYLPIKDEIKKVVDAAAGVVVAVAFLVAGIFLGIFGPMGMVTGAIGVALAIGTLVRASKQLHEKRTQPGIMLEMDKLRKSKFPSKGIRLGTE